MASGQEENPNQAHYLDRFIRNAEQHLLENPPESQKADSVLYVGNWQDAIPRAIWTDPLLDAIDVRAWGLIRIQSRPDAAIVVSINKLLQEKLGYSKPTVSRILYILRLTRWLSLCATVRDEKGRFRGHVYAVHDEPLPVGDAIRLDTGYITFSKQQAHHKSSKIRNTARSLLAMIDERVEMNESVTNEVGTVSKFCEDFSSHFFPTHRVKKINPVQVNLDSRRRVKNINLDADTENQPLSNQVKKLNPVPLCSSRCSSNLNKKTTTTSIPDNSARACEKTQTATVTPDSGLIYPDCLNPSERELARMYLKPVEGDLKQVFLDELGGQILAKKDTTKPIGNPIGYLCWMCDQHAQGKTVLTSRGIRLRENRERQQQIERQTQATQVEIAEYALTLESGKGSNRLARRLEKMSTLRK